METKKYVINERTEEELNEMETIKQLDTESKIMVIRMFNELNQSFKELTENFKEVSENIRDIKKTSRK